MYGMRRKNLYILVATLAVVLLFKFVYLDYRAATAEKPGQLEIEHEIESVPSAAPAPAVAAVPQPQASAAIPLTTEEVEQIQKEDEEHASYLTIAFPAGKLLRKKNLDDRSYANFYLLESGGELVNVFTDNVMTGETWTAANGNTIERSFTAEGRVYALSVREGSYGYTNFYDANMQMTKKIEKTKGQISCVKYEQNGRPVTRELGGCGEDDFKEFEDQNTDTPPSP